MTEPVLDIDVLISADAQVGEGPFWDEPRGVLHWVDIPAGHLHTSDPHRKTTSTIAVTTTLGAAIPKRSGGFVAATGDGFAVIEPSGAFTPWHSFLPDDARMNDAKCDPTGRLWAGSTAIDFTPGRGRLHVLEPDGATRVVLDGLTLPNGIGFSPDRSTMYLADTYAHVVYAFDIDMETASISDQRVLIDFTPHGELPDGLAVDAAGHLWVAMWGGRRLVRVAPDGSVERDVRLPVRQPSSCAFFGKALDRLAVTSAAEGLAADGLEADGAEWFDGAILSLSRLPAPGLPVAHFAG